jgi:sucrose-phosphate synthase
VVLENDLWGKISAFGLSDTGQEALAATYRFMAKRGSVFALTALYEPFGLAPLEAAAAGLPVVATQNGGPSESLGEGDQEYGVLVDPADPADIAGGLERLLCDEKEWEHFAQAGRERVLSSYTWETTAENYLSAIAQILSSPGANRPVELLPIHPYFRNPEPNNDISLEELSRIYFTSKDLSLSPG